MRFPCAAGSAITKVRLRVGVDSAVYRGKPALSTPHLISGDLVLFSVAVMAITSKPTMGSYAVLSRSSGRVAQRRVSDEPQPPSVCLRFTAVNDRIDDRRLTSELLDGGIPCLRFIGLPR